MLLHPIGFTGGGADDSRYLDAARCWTTNGAMCLPDNHWASRRPVLAPIAAGIELFGEGRSSIGLGTLAGWIASIALVGLLGRLWFNRTTGLLAAAWIAVHPGRIESDARTIGALTLLPEARALPPVGSGRPLRLVLATSSCIGLARNRATVIA